MVLLLRPKTAKNAHTAYDALGALRVLRLSRRLRLPTFTWAPSLTYFSYLSD